MPPSGESLKFLAHDLGNSVYTKYCVRQKHQHQTVEKLGNIYKTYLDLLAKDTKVGKCFTHINTRTLTHFRVLYIFNQEMFLLFFFLMHFPPTLYYF